MRDPLFARAPMCPFRCPQVGDPAAYPTNRGMLDALELMENMRIAADRDVAAAEAAAAAALAEAARREQAAIEAVQSAAREAAAAAAAAVAAAAADTARREQAAKDAAAREAAEAETARRNQVAALLRIQGGEAGVGANSRIPPIPLVRQVQQLPLAPNPPAHLMPHYIIPADPRRAAVEADARYRAEIARARRRGGLPMSPVRPMLVPANPRGAAREADAKYRAELAGAAMQQQAPMQAPIQQIHIQPVRAVAMPVPANPRVAAVQDDEKYEVERANARLAPPQPVIQAAQPVRASIRQDQPAPAMPQFVIPADPRRAAVEADARYRADIENGKRLPARPIRQMLRPADPRLAALEADARYRAGQ